MRIVYASFLHPEMHAGGAQQVAYEMFSAARNLGHVSAFVAAVPRNFAPKGIPTQGGLFSLADRSDEYMFVPDKYEFDTFRIGSAVSQSLLVNFISEFAPDVVHFHHYHCVGASTLTHVRQSLPRCRIVLHLHEMLALCWRNGQMINSKGRICDQPHSNLCADCNPGRASSFFSSRENAIKSAFASVDVFVVPSDYLKRIYVSWGLPSERIRVVENGLKSPPGLRKLPVSDRLASFGFFGQLLDAKGLDVLIEAIQIIAEGPEILQIRVDINGGNLHFASKEFQLRIIDLHRLRADWAKKGIDAVLLGSYSRTQLVERMERVDWVIVPSTWGETFGLVLSEAWMFGRVPIVSRVGALADRVLDNINGLHVEVGDAKALAATMRSVIGNNQLHKRLSRAAPQARSDVDMFREHLVIYS